MTESSAAGRADAQVAGRSTPLPPEALEARLLAVLDERYHHRHPFHLRMHAGELSPEELRCWVRNRYCYQTRIPTKDSVILAKAADPAFRREWVRRLHDHDGRAPGEGGLELWLDLAEAVGLDRGEVASLRAVLPGVRRACDAYVEFVSGHDLLESVAASLTERAAGEIMRVRLEAFRRHYPWVAPEGLRYFETRTRQAPRDARFGMAFVLEHARTAEAQARAVGALERKCEILWSLLDAVEEGCRPLRVASRVLLRDDPEAPPGGGVAVLPERAVELNATAREVLELADGSRGLDGLLVEMARRHPGAADLAGEVDAFVREMMRLGVLERVS